MKFVLPIWFLFTVGLLPAIAFAQTDDKAVDTRADATKQNRIINFDNDIAPILRDKCLSCHQGDTAKNGFIVSDKDALLGFLEPGNAGSSSLWTDYLIQPPVSQVADSLVMPPEGPLSVSELAILKLWIDEGADWPGDSEIGIRKEVPIQPALGQPVSLGVKIYRATGYFHPAMVHFPIALYLLGGGVAFLSYFLGPRCKTTAYQCLVVAALTSIVTVVMGWAFADVRGYSDWNKMLTSDATHAEVNFFFHRWLGTATAVLGMLAVVVGLLARRYKSNALGHVWRLGAMLLAILVGLVGHQGGELVYGDIFEKAVEQLYK
jgi:uncharacterized membrane protein